MKPELEPHEVAMIDQIVASVSEHTNDLLRTVTLRLAAIADNDEESVESFSYILGDLINKLYDDPVITKHTIIALTNNLVQAMCVHANMKPIELEHEISVHELHPMGNIGDIFSLIQVRETRFNCDPDTQTAD